MLERTLKGTLPLNQINFGRPVEDSKITLILPMGRFF